MISFLKLGFYMDFPTKASVCKQVCVAARLPPPPPSQNKRTEPHLVISCTILVEILIFNK